MIKIMYINNDGSGFAGEIEVEEGTTVQQLFDKKMSGENPANFLIRVNRQPVTASQVLQANDRVAITATKIAGA